MHLFTIPRILSAIRSCPQSFHEDSRFLDMGLHLQFHYLVGNSKEQLIVVRVHKRYRPARISLMLSISRILTPAEPLFKYTILVAMLFFLLMTASIIQVAVFCARNTLWTFTPPFQCAVPKSAGIYFVTSTLPHKVVRCWRKLPGDVTADVMLIAIPLRIFWHVRLPAVERYLILGGFAASILTTMASIACAIILLGPIFHGLEEFLLDRMMVQLLVGQHFTIFSLRFKQLLTVFRLRSRWSSAISSLSLLAYTGCIKKCLVI